MKEEPHPLFISKLNMHFDNTSPSPPADGGPVCKNMCPKNGIRLC